MNRFKKCLAVLVLLFCANPVIAADFKQSIGSGIQFGGLLGWQGSIINSNNAKFRLSFGYSGTAIGYERFVSPNLSLGAQFFGNQYVSGGGLSANYYFSGRETSGWILGLDVYRGYNTGEQALESIIRFFEFIYETDIIDYDAKIKTGAFVSIGYQF